MNWYSEIEKKVHFSKKFFQRITSIVPNRDAAKDCIPIGNNSIKSLIFDIYRGKFLCSHVHVALPLQQLQTSKTALVVPARQ